MEKLHKRIVLASLDVLQTRDFQEGGVSPNSVSLGELSTLRGPLLGNLVLDEQLQGSVAKLEKALLMHSLVVLKVWWTGTATKLCRSY